MQSNPSPENPVTQAQVKLPTLFEHVACALQPPLLVRHSSTSAVNTKKKKTFSALKSYAKTLVG